MNEIRQHMVRTGRPSPTLLSVVVLAIAAGSLHPLPAALAADSDTASGPSNTVIRLGLDDAVALALANDEQLQQAQLAVDGAAADLQGARSGTLPQLDVAASWTANLKKAAFFLPPDMAASFGGVTQIEMGRDRSLAGALSLTWTLWSAGRLSAGVGASREALVASRWQERAVADAVRYAAEVAYCDALLAAEQVRIAEAALAMTEESLRVAVAGHEQGRVSRFDLLRARVELANRESPLIAARNAHDLGLLYLRRVCGIDAGTPIELIDDYADIPAPAPLEDLLGRMAAGSPELRMLTHGVAAQRQVLALAKAGRGPVVQLQGSYVLQGEWDDGLFPGDDERATSGSVALAVSMPLFDGFAAKADIGRAEADLRIAETERDRVERDRRLAVRQARLNLENALTALEGRQESVSLAEEAHRLSLVRLENGLATPLERLDAELALTEARAQLASTRHDCNTARAALELAVGSADEAVEVDR